MVKRLLTNETLNIESTLEAFQEAKSKYQRTQKIQFKCLNCQKPVERYLGRLDVLFKRNALNFLCKQCGMLQTATKKYGSLKNYYTQRAQKSLQTKIENNTLNSEKRIKALQKTFQIKNDQIQEKRKQTNVEKYGNEKALYIVKCEFCGKEMDNTHITRHKKCCSKNPKNYVTDNYLKLNEENVQKLKALPKQLQRNQKVTYICKTCGKEVKLGTFVRFKSFDRCSICDRKKTNQQRYGGNAPCCNPEISRKQQITASKRTSEERELSEAKRRKTNLERYGVEYVAQNKTIRQKQIETLISKSIEEKQNIQQKVKETNLKNLGVEYPSQSSQIQEKMKKTFQEHYGVNNIFKSEDFKKHRNNVCLEKYNSTHPTCKYIFENERFDSSWELALFIYAKDHNEEILREPCYFEYEYQGKNLKYYPDFRYKNQLIEIKGNQFLKNDGTFRNCYGEDNNKQELKHQCGLKNNVQFWSYENIKFALDYCEKKYSKDYLKSFKIA